MPDSAAARIRLACVPAIYGDSDLLPAVVAGGEAAWGAYSYINSLAGIACQMRRLGAGVCMPMLGAARRRGPASRSSSGG